MEYWKNNKTGEQELISGMNPRQLAYKLSLLASRINNHQSKMESLTKLRHKILINLATKGRKADRLEDLGKEFIAVQDDGEPVVVTMEILYGNDLDPSFLIKNRRLIVLPETSKDEEL